MNIDIDGKSIIIERLVQETDSQMLCRKQFLMKGLINNGKLVSDDKIFKRIELSRYFHNVVFKGVSYSKHLHDAIDLPL